MKLCANCVSIFLYSCFCCFDFACIHSTIFEEFLDDCFLGAQVVLCCIVHFVLLALITVVLNVYASNCFNLVWFVTLCYVLASAADCNALSLYKADFNAQPTAGRKLLRSRCSSLHNNSYAILMSSTSMNATIANKHWIPSSALHVGRVVGEATAKIKTINAGYIKQTKGQASTLLNDIHALLITTTKTATIPTWHTWTNTSNWLLRINIHDYYSF